MPKQPYSDEFKRDAVALYETTPGTSFNTIARDLTSLILGEEFHPYILTSRTANWKPGFS